jgi:hypothetical protein
MPWAFSFDPTLDGLQIARLYEITRLSDGVVVRLTDADNDVVIGGAVTFYAMPAVTFSPIRYSKDGRANLCEVAAVMQSGGLFDPLDVGLRKFASATLAVYLVDLSSTATSSLVFGGLMADQTYSEDQTGVTFEFRADIALAKTLSVRLFGALCRANLGDYLNAANPGLCKLPFKPDDVLRDTDYPVGAFFRVRSGTAGNPLDYANRFYEVTAQSGPTAHTQPTYDTTVGHPTVDGGVTVIARQANLRTVTVASIASSGAGAGYTFTISDPGDARIGDGGPPLRSFALGWMALAGNYGRSYEIRAYTHSTKTVALWEPLTRLMQVGSVIDLSPGCDKRKVETCAGVYANVVNNRSEA